MLEFSEFKNFKKVLIFPLQQKSILVTIFLIKVRYVEASPITVLFQCTRNMKVSQTSEKLVFQWNWQGRLFMNLTMLKRLNDSKVVLSKLYQRTEFTRKTGKIIYIWFESWYNMYLLKCQNLTYLDYLLQQ